MAYQYRLNGGPGALIESADPLDEEQLAEQQEAWDNICDEEEYAQYLGNHFPSLSLVLPTAPEEQPAAQILITVEEYDRLRKAAGEL